GGFGAALPWIVLPIVLGAAWFATAMRIAGTANPSGNYAFLVYYGWLGDSFVHVLLSALRHPIVLLRHFISLGNVDMAIGLTMPLLFFPLLRVRWLLLALPPLVMVLLGASGGSNLIVELHYCLLFLPALVPAAIEGFDAWLCGRTKVRTWIEHHLPLPPQLAIVIAVLMYTFTAAALGPIGGVASEWWSERGAPLPYVSLLSQLPKDASVAVSDRLLPFVAARHEVYALSYTMLGVGQFAQHPYALPDDLDAMVLDAREVAIDLAVHPTVAWAAPYADGELDRLARVVAGLNLGLLASDGDVTLLARDIGEPYDWTRVTEQQFERGERYVDPIRDVIFRSN
ncbi:MAG: DUF2079 domain-containing protein, partial [Candidatus Uhrbacteria bacterium]